MNVTAGCLATVAALVATTLYAAGPAPDLRIVREGVALSVTEPERVVSLLTGLIEGSSVNSTSHVEVDRAWASGLVAPSFIHLRLGGARDMRVMDTDNQTRRRMPVQEILLVVPTDAWPGHILLRTAAGRVAVTKYPPCGLAELMLASHLAALDAGRQRFASEVLLKTCRQESAR